MMLGQRPDVGIAVGLVVGAAACSLANTGIPRLNARGSRQQREHDPARDGRGQHRVDAVHHSPVTG